MATTIVLPTVGLRSGAMVPAHARARRSSIHPVACWFVHLSSPDGAAETPSFWSLWVICWLLSDINFRKSAATCPAILPLNSVKTPYRK